MKSKTASVVVSLGLLAVLTTACTGRQVATTVDEEYTRLIKEATTKPEFSSPLVATVRRVEGVPTPKEVLGYIAGAPGKLTYYEDIVKYMNALAKAAPNVRVFPIGRSSEGREMIIVAIADRTAIDNLARYKELMARLADPRLVKTEEEADAIIAEAKPIYWLTGNIHSAETGAAETSMELAYRLAVDDDPFVRRIRDNLIVLITPSVEPDGHDKQTDWFYKYNKDVTEFGKIAAVPYWGKYIFHDNNRDMISISQPETLNEANAFYEWHPVVLQDNHESQPYLYVSSGTGPPNPTYRASVGAEQCLLAWSEISRMTGYGMPGVWTHGTFWDYRPRSYASITSNTFWAPSYLFSVANNHNALGRFYETFGNGGFPNTMERQLPESVAGITNAWNIPILPYKSAAWSIRNNVNYQETADLTAMYTVATYREEFLRNFWKRGFDSYHAGRNEAPHAYIIPSGQRDPVDAAYLVNILLRQKIEVHQTQGTLTVKEGTFPAGSYVVRLDQPYRDLAVNLLGIQRYPSQARATNDDTAWSLGLDMQVQTVETADAGIFNVPLVPIERPVRATGAVAGGQTPAAYIINHGTINTLLSTRFRLKDFKIQTAEEPFIIDGQQFSAGSMIVPTAGAAPELRRNVDAVAAELGLGVFGAGALPPVKTHELGVPRIAVYHTWSSTQDDGWVRFALDQLGVPFAMINNDQVRKGNLKGAYDVIIVSNCAGSVDQIVNGRERPGRGPLAYVKSAEFKHIGTPDASEDIGVGLGSEGVKNLQQFAEEGGRLLFLHNPVRLPVELGFVKGITIFTTGAGYFNRGSIVRAEVASARNPIAYGYDRDVAIYQSPAGPLLSVPPQMEKFVVVRYAKEGVLCLSGLVEGENEIRGKAAIIDVPLGKGQVTLFTFNPFWRDLTHGSYMFVFNAILNWNYRPSGEGR